MQTIIEQIKQDLANNDVVLYLKGRATKPLCGFSATVVNILNNMGVVFKDIDVLGDHQLREEIKKFTDWPTIPQLYIKGEFIGGCDITKELYESGELANIFKEKKILFTKQNL